MQQIKLRYVLYAVAITIIATHPYYEAGQNNPWFFVWWILSIAIIGGTTLIAARVDRKGDR